MSERNTVNKYRLCLKTMSVNKLTQQRSQMNPQTDGYIGDSGGASGMNRFLSRQFSLFCEQLVVLAQPQLVTRLQSLACHRRERNNHINKIQSTHSNTEAPKTRCGLVTRTPLCKSERGRSRTSVGKVKIDLPPFFSGEGSDSFHSWSRRGNFLLWDSLPEAVQTDYVAVKDRLKEAFGHKRFMDRFRASLSARPQALQESLEVYAAEINKLQFSRHFQTMATGHKGRRHFGDFSLVSIPF